MVHPHYGAGVITEIQERHSLGPRKGSDVDTAQAEIAERLDASIGRALA